MIAFVNIRINLMNLQFGSEKCVRMHVEKKNIIIYALILQVIHGGKR